MDCRNNNKNGRQLAQQANKNKKLPEHIRQQKQEQDVSELSVLGTGPFSGSQRVPVTHLKRTAKKAAMVWQFPAQIVTSALRLQSAPLVT